MCDFFEYNRLSRLVSLLFLITITLSTLSFIVETLEAMQPHAEVFFNLEKVFFAIFTTELVLRLFSCRSIVRFLLTPLNIVDVLAVVPFFIELAYVNADPNSGSNMHGLTRSLRILRLARVMRLFKLSRHASYMNLMTETVCNNTLMYNTNIYTKSEPYQKPRQISATPH